MTRVLAAIYEDGVLKPLQDLGLEEHQRVELEIRYEPRGEASSALEAWHKVYEGLSEEEISAIDAIALDREHFLSPER